MADTEVIPGEIYLERKILEHGNYTSSSTVSEIYWRAKLDPDGSIRMIMLDMEGNSTGVTEVVTQRAFNKRFLHQPGYEELLSNPAAAKTASILTTADKHFAKKEYNSAEYEYKKALDVTPESGAALSGLVRIYLAKGDNEQARALFSRLKESCPMGQPEQKHDGNDLAMQLRKAGLIREAVEQYSQILNLTHDDEHLWFNLGRAVDEQGNSELAARLMTKALEVNAEFREALLYLQNYLSDQPGVEQVIKRFAPPPPEPPKWTPPPTMDPEVDMDLDSAHSMLSLEHSTGGRSSRRKSSGRRSGDRKHEDDGPYISLDF
jgi:tetratricopeptide (TPR) repeat protein